VSKKITVITVCLNCCKFIAQAIESVQAQSYDVVEHVIIDGGSTDATLDIVRKYALRSAQLHWISEPDRGIAHAMNKGVALASGEIIGFLHADDLFPHGDVLANVVAVFDGHPMATWATGGLRIVDGKGSLLKEIAPRRYSFRRLLRNNIIMHPSTFIRRQALVEAGVFDERYHYAMDYHLWLRLAEQSEPLIIDSALACWRAHVDSLSTVYADAALTEEYLIRTDYLIKSGRALWPHQIWHFLRRPLNRMFYGRLLRRMHEEG
jgi:glycosyltransferase involved in cell wall biosynthesis